MRADTLTNKMALNATKPYRLSVCRMARPIQVISLAVKVAVHEILLDWSNSSASHLAIANGPTVRVKPVAVDL